MDEQQDKAFREAVERKKEKARAKSEATKPDRVPPEGEPLPLEQPSLIEDNTPPDVQGARDHSTRHGKVTADKWNQ